MAGAPKKTAGTARASRPASKAARAAERAVPAAPAKAQARSASRPSRRLATHDELPFDPTKQVLWSRPGFLVRRLNQIHYAMFFEECRSQNITPVQYGILTALSLNPWLDQTQIGQELGLDRTTTADVIKRLQERGLLERRINPSDRRSRQALITQEGLSVMGMLQKGMLRAQQRVLAPLSPRDRQTFMELLSRLVDANNQYSRAIVKGSI